MAFINTDELREAAIFFQKHGRYDNGLKGSRQYKDYWNREKKRCEEGYTSPTGISITGMHYEYLNYSQIEIVKVVEGKKQNSSGTQDADRYPDFPDFWQEDYKYFWILHIAKHGIEVQELRRLEKWFDDVDLPDVHFNVNRFNLIETEENLGGGKHVCWTKPRGMGASWKGAEIPVHRYFHGKANKTFLLAEDKTFLTGDGLYTKFLFKLNFINTYTEFAQPNDYKHESVGMHYRASYHDSVTNTERGLMNEVIGESLKDDPEKARGKRGYILWEEAGKFRGLASAYNIAMKSVSQDGAVFATNVVFGTGGLDKENFKDLESMFYDPDSYDMLKFNNIYDKGRLNTECCYFTPAFINPRHKDKDGNSNVYEGYKFLQSVRLKKAKGTNPQALAQEKTEKPYSPSEAFLKVTSNLFPVDELQLWKTEIITSHIKDFGTYGTFEYMGGDVRFKVDMNLLPVKEYKLDKNLNLNGCIVQYEQPYKREGRIPDNLYFICVDPYGGDSAGGGKKSIGVCYVMKNINNYSQPDNCIVASYIARPDSTDDFYKNLWLLAEYYNAKIAFENDRGDGLISYFKAKKLMKWLLPEFELGFNENMPKSTVKRGFGMHMGSGKDNVRKNQGDKYIDEWLRETRRVNEDGEKKYGLHTILDIGLIDELSNYDDSNFDRIAALRIGMYALRELDYKDTSKLKGKINKAFSTLSNLKLY